jgi:hypothetical protein
VLFPFLSKAKKSNNKKHNKNLTLSFPLHFLHSPPPPFLYHFVLRVPLFTHNATQKTKSFRVSFSFFLFHLERERERKQTKKMGTPTTSSHNPPLT